MLLDVLLLYNMCLAVRPQLALSYSFLAYHEPTSYSYRWDIGVCASHKPPPFKQVLEMGLGAAGQPIL
jgi:hypothetical protein